MYCYYVVTMYYVHIVIRVRSTQYKCSMQVRSILHDIISISIPLVIIIYKEPTVLICTCRYVWYEAKVHETRYTPSFFITCICICICICICTCICMCLKYNSRSTTPSEQTSPFQQPCSKPKLEPQYIDSDRAELGWGGFRWFLMCTRTCSYMRKAGRTYVAQMGAGNDKLTD